MRDLLFFYLEELGSEVLVHVHEVRDVLHPVLLELGAQVQVEVGELQQGLLVDPDGLDYHLAQLDGQDRGFQPAIAAHYVHHG